MLKETFIALLVLVIIVLAYSHTAHWVRLPGVDMAKGVSASFWKLLPDISSESACGRACRGLGGWKYIWGPKDKSACKCYVVPPGATKDANYNSAYFNPGLTHTLQRRLGSQSAGVEKYATNNCVGTFDCLHNERFETNDVATNTMYDGYYKGSVLPI